MARKNLSKWPSKFRNSLELLCILVFVRCAYGYFLLYAVAGRPFFAAPVLAEWAFALAFFGYYAYTKPRKWRYKRWIAFTCFLLIANALAIFVFFGRAINFFERADQQMMALSGLPWYPTGHFPHQWTLPSISVLLYSLLFLTEFVIVRPYSLFCAYKCWVRESKLQKHATKIGSELIAAFYAQDDDDLLKRRAKLYGLRWLVQISFFTFVACFFLSLASYSNLHARPRCGKGFSNIAACYAHCEPELGDEIRDRLCLVPFPSTHFMVADETKNTRLRIDIRADSMPLMRAGGRLLFDMQNDQKDGFSTMTPLIFTFWDFFADKQLPFGAPTEATLHNYTNDQTIAVIDMSSSQRHAVWLQIDPHCDEMQLPKQEVCMILARPAFPFQHATRYLVAVRGFNTTHIRALPLNQTQKNVLCKSNFECVNFDGIQLAWEFVTESKHESVHLLDRIYESLKTKRNVSTIEIVTVEQEECTEKKMGRTIHGFAHVARIIDTTDDSSIGRITFGNDGKMTRVRFSMYIACEVLLYKSNETHPVHVVQYGHTVLGRTDDFVVDPVHKIVRDQKWIVFCTEWRAISIFQFYMSVRLLMQSVQYMFAMSDSVSLSIVEKRFIFELLLDFAANKENSLERDDGSSVFEQIEYGAYWGHSFGAIVGSGYAMYSPSITKAALISGGAPSVLAVYRSDEYESMYALAMRLSMYSQEDVATTFVLLQTVMNANDASAFTSDTHKKSFLVHGVVADTTVPLDTTHDMARMLGCAATVPALFSVFGVSTENENSTSFYTEFSYGNKSTAVVWPHFGIAYHTSLRFNSNSTNAIVRFVENGVSGKSSPCEIDQKKTACAQQTIVYD